MGMWPTTPQRINFLLRNISNRLGPGLIFGTN